MTFRAFHSASLTLALLLAGASVNASESAADARAYAKLDAMVESAQEIRDAHAADYERLLHLRSLYSKNENEAAIIEERNEIVPRLQSATTELREIRDEFKESSRGIEMRLMMSGLSAAMAKTGQGLAVGGLSRFMGIKTRMGTIRTWTRDARHLLLEEKAEFVLFEKRYEQKKRAIAGAAIAAVVVMAVVGFLFYRRARAPRALPPAA
jgi:hypothetical protein